MVDSQVHLPEQDDSKLYQVLYGLAVVTAFFATFFAVSNVDPIRPTPPIVYVVLAINAALIMIIGWLLYRRYSQLQKVERARGDGRLVRRFLLLFSASSVVPATIVAIVLGTTLTRGIDNWFGTRMGAIIEDTSIIAQEQLDTLSALVEARSREVAARLDFEDTAEGIESDPVRYADYLGIQAQLLGARAGYVIGPDGALIIMGTVDRPVDFNEPPLVALQEAREGLVGQTLYQNGLVTAVVKLSHPSDAFVLLIHELDPGTFIRLQNAAEAVEEFTRASNVTGQIRWLFLIGYAQIVMLALLLFARLGLDAGSRIAAPLARMATAAERVRDGDLTARVVVPGNEDEIDTLATTFNTMAAQLGTQRAALLTARSDSEDRRHFLETLLSQISAGVIRTDQSMTITLANASAERLIGRTDLHGKPLRDIVPEFQSHAQSSPDVGITDDISLEANMDGDIKHIRLRTLKDADGGCVLTFDDATRMVTAQRHMAWRDVARRIAHEIRNPLTPIHLAAERLERRYSNTLEEDDTVFKRSLETITRQADDIGRMVDEFSKFARMPKPQIRPFGLIGMLSDAAFSQRMVTPEIAINIATKMDGIIYYGDERLLSQAIGNLLKNAAHAIAGMPEEDEVIGQITITAMQSDDILRLYIDDNGPGFPEESRDRLLEPYVTTKDRGTGLGLAIVNRVIIDHGGSISLSPRADDQRGASVHIALPFGTTPSNKDDTKSISDRNKS